MKGISLGILILIISIQAYSQTLIENLSSFVELEHACTPSNTAGWNTPVVTYRDVVYFAFIDNNKRLVISRRNTVTNQTQTTVITSNIIDDHHHVPSVGVDAQGYIHVVGGMHDSRFGEKPGDQPVPGVAWQYWVSNQPENISSFSFVGNTARTIPGDVITYPFFATDRKGVLYVTFRGTAGLTNPNKRAAQIAKYDASAKRWTMLGEKVDPNSKYPYKSVGYENAGVGGSTYQGYHPRLFFDKNNWMHLTYVVNVDNSRSSSMNYRNGTHVMYAYSDNGGNTFKRANGKTLKLPITHNDADIVRKVSPGNIEFTNTIFADQEGDPYIIWYEDGITKWSYWKNSGGWTSPAKVPNITMQRAVGFVFDKNNILTYFKRGHIYRTADLGVTIKIYDFKDESYYSGQTFDYYFFQQKNQFRVTGLNTYLNKIKVQSAIFSGNAVTGNTPPAARAGADQTLTDSDGNGNEAITLDASASSDPDGTITAYKWSKNGNQIATGIKPTVNLSVGTHIITLTVTDDDGQSGTDQVVIYVNKSSSSNSGESGNDGYCVASGSTIKQAISNFENACGIKYDKSKGHDCDPDGKGGYICSTGDIGSSGGSSGDDGSDSPSSSDDDKGGSNGYCTASGSTLSEAKRNLEKNCDIKYDKSKGHDCDPDGKGGYICSTGDVNQSTARVSTASTKAVDTEQDAAVSLSENSFEPGDALLIQQVYPNPIQEVINIRVNSQFEDMISINLIDQLGRIYLHKQASIQKGDNLISIELSQISIKPGVLFLRIDSEKMPLKPIKLLKTPSSFLGTFF